MKYKITVITVVFNDLVGIKKTMDSVFEQSYSDFEYIVVDGSSTDGTYEEITKYEDKIDKIIHESDQGVYDAMNKAIRISEGEYIIFMNSSDVFYAPNTIEASVDLFQKPGGEAYYGDHVLISEKGQKEYIKTPRSIDMLWKKMPICHQALFVKLSWHRNNLFDIKNISSDYEIICKLYFEKKINKIDVPIANYLEGGMSETSIIKSTWERFKLATRFRLKTPLYLFFYYSTLIVYLFCKFKLSRIFKRK